MRFTSSAFVAGRRALCAALAAAFVFAGAAAGRGAPAATPDPATIRGAIYIPAGAYNAPQMWRNFNLAETQRDFGYAHAVHLNALRIWASYDYWRMQPDRFQANLDQLLGAAHAHGIRILISLFETCGVVYTGDEMWTTDPHKAFAMVSPNPAVFSPDNQAAWDGPREFVKWFMTHYGNDDRLLAIEVMNEPRKTSHVQPPSVPFAKAMLSTANAMHGSVALTIGIAEDERLADEFIPLGLDVIEFHDNFPRTAAALEHHIRAALAFGAKRHLPVWLGEWQRVRPSGTGFGNQHLTIAEKTPDYASLAAVVHKYPIGSFFWSLMIKRAYLPPQREKGTINGLFWPDGSVWSLADARAIAADPAVNLVQNQTLPPGFP